MLGRAFLVVSALFLALLAFAFYQDFNRPWIPIQQKYAQKYGQDFPMGVQQLFPKVQVNSQFVVERCITCHVPDIAKLGPQEAAKRLGPNHPSVINDAVFAKYGQDTLVCRPAAAASASASPKASPSAAATAAASSPPKGSGSAGGPGTAAPGTPASAPGSPATPGTSAAASCLNPQAQPYYVLDTNGKVVTDPQTSKPVVAQLTGFIPSSYKGLGIDETGCIICHNGNRQATSEAGAHTNLVSNPFGVYDKAPQLYQNSCAQCHGATGEGGKGPPLNDQNRLGFFNNDYYYR